MSFCRPGLLRKKEDQHKKRMDAVAIASIFGRETHAPIFAHNVDKHYSQLHYFQE
jgi:hypothetical protein